MGKRLVVVVLLLAALSAVGWLATQIAAKRRGSAAIARSRRQWEETQYSQEIVCDACGARTTGLALNRAQAGNFQVCPECGQTAGRPVVYFMCLNPECNQQLIRIPNSVWTGDGPSGGPPVVCPQCRQSRNVTPAFLDLRSAQKKADETGQEFP